MGVEHDRRSGGRDGVGQLVSEIVRTGVAHETCSHLAQELRLVLRSHNVDEWDIVG